MHDTALAAGAAFFAAHITGTRPRILDVGALDVNGSLRTVAPEGAEYVGLDLEPGPGVDVVLQGTTYPFEADSFDACVSVSCFEHDAAFWHSFLEIAKVCRTGAFIFVSAPSNGPYHSYPHDNWRFYPDAGIALARWAQRAGYPIQLIESGILRRRGDIWNDFVAVFQKAADPAVPARFLLDDFPDATNVRRLGREELGNPSVQTEDLVFLAAQHERTAQAEEALRETQAALAAAEEARAGIEAQHTAERQGREADRQRYAQDLAEISARLAAAEAEARGVAQLVARMAALEAELAQAQAHVARVTQSRSWRLTRPLRLLGGWLSAGVGRARD